MRYKRDYAIFFMFTRYNRVGTFSIDAQPPWLIKLARSPSPNKKMQHPAISKAAQTTGHPRNNTQ